MSKLRMAVQSCLPNTQKAEKRIRSSKPLSYTRQYSVGRSAQEAIWLEESVEETEQANLWLWSLVMEQRRLVFGQSSLHYHLSASPSQAPKPAAPQSQVLCIQAGEQRVSADPSMDQIPFFFFF